MILNSVSGISGDDQFYVLQQFIGRGSAREVENGMAKGCQIRVYDQADFEPFIKRGLPGCTWTVEAPAKRAPRRDTKTSKLTLKLIEHMSTYTGDRVSVSALKGSLGALDVNAKLFTRSLTAALESLDGWSRDGRSVVRI